MSTAEVFLLLRVILSIVGLVACSITLFLTIQYYFMLQSLDLTSQENKNLDFQVIFVVIISRVVAMSLLFIIHLALIYITMWVWMNGLGAPRTPISVAYVILQIAAATMALNNWWTMKIIMTRRHE